MTVVHPDKVPMAPGFGQQPRFIVTIQPSGAIFSPPAPITLPNVDGLKPQAITEMYSFDHDISSFVAIGTGTVSDDGLVIRSNAGVGVLKAGWHCGGDPRLLGTTAYCAECNRCIPTGAHPEGECKPDDTVVPIGPPPTCRLQQCSNGVAFPPGPDGANPSSASSCCFNGNPLSKLNNSYDVLQASCPKKKQGTRLREFDGCTSYPDNAVSISGSRANVPGTSTVIGTIQPNGATPDPYPCNTHDFRWQTCGQDKDAADAELRDGVVLICEAAYPTETCPYPANATIGSENKCSVYFDERASCFRSPGQLFSGVQSFIGRHFFKEDQEKYCQCCP